MKPRGSLRSGVAGESDEATGLPQVRCLPAEI